jgi:hypothetical protein
VGITHKITTIIVRTSASQPYTSTDPNTLLDQFRVQWTTNHGNVTRDIAHLFTGKELDGSVIGIAWLGVVCNSSYGYGLVQSGLQQQLRLRDRPLGGTSWATTGMPSTAPAPATR